MTHAISRTSVREVKSYDPVWSRITEEAEEVVAREPDLSSFVFTTVLNHDKLEDAISLRLAQLLGTADVGPMQLRTVFSEALEADPDISAAIRADIVAIQDRDPACDRYLEPVLYFKGFHAVQTYRINNWLWRQGRKDFATYIQSRASAGFGVDIHPGASVGCGLMIDHATGVVIGETAVVEDDVSILHGVTLGGTGKEGGDRHPKVRHGVLLGAGAIILGNIEVGACAKVASGSVVLKDVPPNRTVAGVPAKVVGYSGCDEPARKMDHMIDDSDFDRETDNPDGKI